MILLFALAGGLPAGLVWSRWRGFPYQAPDLRVLWLAFLAFLPQFLLLYLPVLRASDLLVAVSLMASVLCFLVFTWLNRHVPGMKILLLGLALNLIVMAANRGFMPINPQTAGALIADETLQKIEPGSRIGIKDILLPVEQTRFEWLADRFLTPDWFSYRVAFSLGDVFIALGAFAILALSGTTQTKMNRGVLI